MKKFATKSMATLLAVLMLFSCVAVSASADETSYRVLRQSCTIYGDTGTQRGFAWFTAEDCDTVIQVVPEAEFTKTFSNAYTFEGASTKFQDYYSHKAVATGLEPGVTYYYRVGSAEQNTWSNVGKFVTDDGNKAFSFLAIADVQASNFENFNKASKVMAAAMATDKDAEFYVNLGDFVNDCTNDEWNFYGENFEYANTNLSLVPVAGNHEGNPTNKLNPGWFNNTFNLKAADGSPTVNGVYYSYDYGNAHFVVVNSNDMYPMTEAQRNWIINDLHASTATWKVLLMHRSAYSAGKNINKPDTLIMRNTIIDIVDQTDVDLVLSGHDHMYMRTKQVAGDAVCEGTKYVTEKYNGVNTTFAVDPDGAIYALPGTAGTKRYSVNENAIDPIFECADKYFAQKDEMAGGCFADIKIDGGKLVYKAYVVNDETGKVSLVDEYAIKKTSVPENDEDYYILHTDFIGTIDNTVSNFITEFFGVIITYISKLLPQVVTGAIGK